MPITIDGTNGITQAGEFNSDSSFGFKNRIINGDFKISQYNGTSSVTPSGNAYIIDRYRYIGTQASKFTFQQLTSTPPTGFAYYLGATVASAVSVGASDYFFLLQRIEGLNTYDLEWGTANAKTVTLSFLVRSSLTGTFGGVIQNGPNNYSYPFTYSIPTANTWTTISITVAGPTAGTWVTNNDSNIQVNFGLGAGATFSGTAGSWSANQYYNATGAVSVVGTAGATWQVTGVQLEVGSTATSFDYRPIGTELALCQRYYYQHARGANQNIGVGCYYNSSTFVGFVQFPVTMRTAPSLVSSNTLGDFVFYRNDAGDTFDTFTGINEPSTTSANIRNNTQASGTAGQAGLTITANSTSLLAFNSEL
jgi:hypothetical protein